MNYLVKDLISEVHVTQDTFSFLLASNKNDVFKAHFPDNPLLPGFMFLDISSFILSHNIKQIKKAKFLKMVYPLDRLNAKYKIKENIVVVDFYCNSEKVCMINYTKEDIT